MNKGIPRWTKISPSSFRVRGEDHADGVEGSFLEREGWEVVVVEVPEATGRDNHALVGVLADDHHADDLEASHVQLLDTLLDDLAELQTAATHHARIIILVCEILFQHFGDDFPDLLDEKQEDVRLDWIIIIILFYIISLLEYYLHSRCLIRIRKRLISDNRDSTDGSTSLDFIIRT